jgi:hypothetical protein
VALVTKIGHDAEESWCKIEEPRAAKRRTGTAEKMTSGAKMKNQCAKPITYSGGRRNKNVGWIRCTRVASKTSDENKKTAVRKDWPALP